MTISAIESGEYGRYHRHDLDQIPQLQSLLADHPRSLRAVSAVPLFRVDTPLMLNQALT